MRQHAFLACIFATTGLSAQEWTIINPTTRDCPAQVIRLPLEIPTTPFCIVQGDTRLPAMVDDLDGERRIRVLVDLPKKSKITVRLENTAPPAFATLVKREQNAESWTLDNGLIAVRLPKVQTQGPIQGLRLTDGRWIGASTWKIARTPTSFRSEAIGDGSVLAAVRLIYGFDGTGGVLGQEVAHWTVTVRLEPGARHVCIDEDFALSPGDSWDLTLSEGWNPRVGLSKQFSQGPGGGNAGDIPAENRPLLPWTNTRQMTTGLYLNVLPRWNQHFRDGWFFAASDSAQAAGAVAVQASRWRWPHDNAIAAMVQEDGSSARLHLSLERGARRWWLVAETPEKIQPKPEYMQRYAFEDLDTLNRDFILEWPGVTKGGFQSLNIYDTGQINPTGMIRRQGRAALANAEKTGDLSTLFLAQIFLHRNSYGSYWDFFSPENPNFFTDFLKVPLGLTCSLKTHPRFAALGDLALARLKEDLYHSITLPGGAGQECPGYLEHSVQSWLGLAGPIKEHLGYDLAKDERILATTAFRRRISQPDGTIRRTLPIGDTHPDNGGPAVVEVAAEEVAAFTTSEIPGFGVIFNNRPGTTQETYCSFKAGPNRGHYHGDQLAIHLCCEAKPLAVDHYCSYHPRAGQEHLHNRLAFSTPELPYANLDGYERLIALATGPQADIAVGEVSGSRLRTTREVPPEAWHQEWPQVQLGGNLSYTRTVALVKGPSDAVVLVDHFKSPKAVQATWCLHGRDASIVRGKWGISGCLIEKNVFLAEEPIPGASIGDVVLFWKVEKKKKNDGSIETTYHQTPQRHIVQSIAGNSLSLNPPISSSGTLVCIVLDSTLRSEPGGVYPLGGLRVHTMEPQDLIASSFPWAHVNGALEVTQGLRLSLAKPQTQGRVITVVTWNKDLKVTTETDGTITIGPSKVRISADGSIAIEGPLGRSAIAQKEWNYDRFQGNIGLFIPDAGYPFGPIPDWLLKQRFSKPDWYQAPQAMGWKR